MLDKTLPTVAACLDATLRTLGGVPTYCLTDNEKTVTVEHVARIAVRNPELAAIARYYGTVVRSCVPADPASKGGTEATARIAKRDLVPTAVNLHTEYADFAELQQACKDFMTEVNSRVHRETRRIPAQLLPEERLRLHPVPEQPFTAVIGETKSFGNDSTISVESVRYSLPHELVDERVCVCFHGDELIVTAMVAGSAAEGARPSRSAPGSPRIVDEHHPDARAASAHPGRRTRPRHSSWRWARGDSLAGRGHGDRRPPDPGEDARRRHPGEAARDRRRRPGAGHRGDGRPVHRGRLAIDPGPPG